MGQIAEANNSVLCKSNFCIVAEMKIQHGLHSRGIVS